MPAVAARFLWGSVLQADLSQSSRDDKHVVRTVIDGEVGLQGVS